MPDRNIQDALPQCAPVTRTKYVKQTIHVRDLPVSQTDAGLFTPGIGTTIGYVEDEDGGDIVIDGGGHPPAASLILTGGNLAAGKEFAVTTRVANADGSPLPVHITIYQDDGNGNDVMLADALVL